MTYKRTVCNIDKSRNYLVVGVFSVCKQLLSKQTLQTVAQKQNSASHLFRLAICIYSDHVITLTVEVFVILSKEIG